VWINAIGFSHHFELYKLCLEAVKEIFLTILLYMGHRGVKTSVFMRTGKLMALTE
jgi:hypothetical protein